MEYPRLAHRWRTHPVESAEGGNLSAEAARAAARSSHPGEQTESREELARSRRTDPESTEEMLAANATPSHTPSSIQGNPAGNGSNGSATVAARLTGLPSHASARPDVTHPIELPRARTAPPVIRVPPKVHLAHDDDNSAELVELVVEHDEPRTCVNAGDTLAGRYTICEKVDHCGMGVVFKALDRRREKAGVPMPWVALKFARADAGDGTTATYLRQEFLKLSQLNHPNIVSVFDFDSDGGLDFIVMEWLEGHTLADMLSRITSKRIALHKAQEIIQGVASALAHAHELGVVHGDVKPSNIFLTGNRGVKLLDFGSSIQASSDAEGEGNWATRAYASCQVLEGASPQPHDDVYSLGVTAYRLMSGERPFNDLDAAEAEATGAVPDPLPPDAERSWPAIEHALRFAALDRPANAGEFLMELVDPPLDTSEPKERSQLEHIAYGAVAIALLLALVAWTVGSISGVSVREQDLLERAETAFEDGRLAGPDDSSAFALYSAVLQAAPGHPDAVAGLERITEHYLADARRALADDDPRAASEFLEIARRVMPDHYGIPILGDLIDRYGKDLLLRAREAAPGDPEEAGRLLARASAFLPEDDPGVVAVAGQLRKMQDDARLQELLQGIDQRILAERLSIPNGDSAMDLLRQARELAPGDRQVMLAADRLATALIFQAMFAISGGNLDEAQQFIEGAKSLGVRHLALSRAEYELAKARHEALRTRGRT